MRIIPGAQPDLWYDVSDLTSRTLVILKRESVTCCGFLGGDSIILASSGDQLAEIFHHFRPVLPYQDRTGSPSDMKEAENRISGIMNQLHSAILQETEISDGSYHILDTILIQLNKDVWLAGISDPFRFHLEICGDLNTFLKGPVYPGRLLSSLLWWYRNEASDKEQKHYPEIPRITQLMYPQNIEEIVRSINLYNHGTYEMTRL